MPQPPAGTDSRQDGRLSEAAPALCRICADSASIPAYRADAASPARRFGACAPSPSSEPCWPEPLRSWRSLPCPPPRSPNAGCDRSRVRSRTPSRIRAPLPSPRAPTAASTSPHHPARRSGRHAAVASSTPGRWPAARRSSASAAVAGGSATCRWRRSRSAPDPACAPACRSAPWLRATTACTSASGARATHSNTRIRPRCSPPLRGWFPSGRPGPGPGRLAALPAPIGRIRHRAARGGFRSRLHSRGRCPRYRRPQGRWRRHARRPRRHGWRGQAWRWWSAARPGPAPPSRSGGAARAGGRSQGRHRRHDAAPPVCEPCGTASL
jgi:hypothetical protein